MTILSNETKAAFDRSYVNHRPLVNAFHRPVDIAISPALTFDMTSRKSRPRTLIGTSSKGCNCHQGSRVYCEGALQKMILTKGRPSLIFTF